MNASTENLKKLPELFDFVRSDLLLSEYSSFKTGGSADIAAYPANIGQLTNLLRYLKSEKIPYTILGNCTNVLIRDKGVRGAVVFTTGLKDISVKDNTVTAHSGVSMAALSNFAYLNSLTGLEPVSGIPGTVGGAVYMNAGSYETQMQDLVISSTYLDSELNIKQIGKDEHMFGCRKSFYTDTDNIILNAVFKLEKGDKDKIKEAMIEYGTRRKNSQPLDLPSCGSVFKRPKGHYAGKLIQDAGLKGYTVGGASVSLKHAGFIVNNGNATTSDILAVMDYIKTVVYNKYEVDLEPEVRVIGEV